MGIRDQIERGLAGAVVTAGAVAVVLVFLRGLGGLSLPPGLALLLMLAGALVGGTIQAVLVGASGRVAHKVLLPDGETTRYQATFSQIEALEARGDLAGAEVAWSEACRDHPRLAIVWTKAADFHLRLLRDAPGARDRYLRVRDMPEAGPELVRYASEKLVDLYLGPLRDEGRALVELRRLIDRFPDTREAQHARAAIARIKAARPADR